MNATGPDTAQGDGDIDRLAELAAFPEAGANADLTSLALAAGLTPETIRKAKGSGQFGAKTDAAFKAARTRALSLQLAPKAMQALGELLGPGNPPAVRLQAAKWVLETTGHRPSAHQVEGGKSLEDLSSDDLAAMIGRLDRALDARAGASLPARKVIPHDTAEPEADAGG